MGAVKYDRDDDPDRDVNTLVWHKRPVERLESGPKGEPAKYGYQRRDTGKIYYTTRRGAIDDKAGAPPPTFNAPAIWLRPRLGAPDRIGKISRAKSKFFDDSIPRCNCTSTHIEDLKIDQGSKLDYRRNCPIHKLVEPGAEDGADDDMTQDEHGCTCESMYRADIGKKRDGRFEPQRRCKVHGPYHAPMTEDDEKEGSTWRQLLRSATRKFKGEDDDSSSDEDDFDDEKIDRVRPRSWAPPRTQTSSTFLDDEKMAPSSMTLGKVGRSQSTRHSVNPMQLGIMTPPIGGMMMRSPTFGTPMMSPPMRVDTKDSTDSSRSNRSNSSARSNGSGKSKYTIPIAYEGDHQATTTTTTNTNINTNTNTNINTNNTPHSKAISIPPRSPNPTPSVSRSHSTRITLKPPRRTPTLEVPSSTAGGVPIPMKSPTGRARSGSNMYAMDARHRVQTMPFPGVSPQMQQGPVSPHTLPRNNKKMMFANRMEYYREDPPMI